MNHFRAQSICPVVDDSIRIARLPQSRLFLLSARSNCSDKHFSNYPINWSILFVRSRTGTSIEKMKKKEINRFAAYCIICPQSARTYYKRREKSPHKNILFIPSLWYYLVSQCFHKHCVVNCTDFLNSSRSHLFTSYNLYGRLKHRRRRWWLYGNNGVKFSSVIIARQQ